MKPAPTKTIALALTASALMFSSSAGAATRASDFVASSTAASASAYQVPVGAQGRAARSGIGALPILLGLAVVAGGLVLLLGDDEDEIRLPVSRG